MAATQTVAAIEAEKSSPRSAKTELLMCIAVGLAGGATQSLALHSSLISALSVGGIFGLAFAVFLNRRATSAGAGLIWGLALAFLVWVMFPAGFGPVINKGFREMAALEGARAQFPLLVAYLVCLGMPVGLALGTYNGVRASHVGSHFSWSRGVIAGGLAGVLGGFIFDRWMSAAVIFHCFPD